MKTDDDKKTASMMLFSNQQQLFRNFISHTDQAEKSINYMQNKLDALFQHKRIQPCIQYLDVGCGYGNKTLPIIHALEKNNAVYTTALDPSENLLAFFKEQKKEECIQFVCSAWEEYSPTEKYNLISSIHAFYYIHDWKAAIEKMLASLDQEGKICIVLRAKDQVCQFRDYFYGKLYSDNRQERNSNELCELLDQLGIDYQVEFVASKLDVRDCLFQNEKGKQLIEFVLRRSYADIDDRIKKEIVTYLEHTHQDGYLSQSDGYVWISV